VATGETVTNAALYAAVKLWKRVGEQKDNAHRNAYAPLGFDNYAGWTVIEQCFEDVRQHMRTLFSGLIDFEQE